MPGKLSTQQAKQRYEQYGFIVPENFHYSNNKRKYRVYDTNNNRYINLSLNELNIYNKRGKILDNEQQAIQQLFNLPLSSQEPKNSFQKWLIKQDNDIQLMSNNDQQELYETMQEITKQMSKKKPFTIDLDNNHIQLRALTLAAKIVAPRLGNIDVRLTFAGDNGLLDYRHLSLRYGIVILFNFMHLFQPPNESLLVFLVTFIQCQLYYTQPQQMNQLST